MAKKVILNEEQLATILNKMASDVIPAQKRYPVNPQQVLIIKDFLDKSFRGGLMDCLGDDGMPSKVQIAIMLGPSGQELRRMFKEDLEDLLNEKYKNMFKSEDERKRFLKQVLSDWYDNKISVYGGLSKNHV